MGSSSQPSHTTQTTEPPAYLRPYLQDAAGEAQNLYRTGGPQYYPGNTVVPFSSQTEQALGRTEQRALNGSPVTNAAQGYATDVLGGKYLNANPYLDATFNRAFDQVQNRVQSGFAGAGRNVEAGRGLAAQEGNDLAAQIYGGAYAQERQNQQAMVPFSNQLANQDYVDLNALQGVGGQVEDLAGRYMEDNAARWDFGQNAPQTNLDNYLQRLGMVAGGAGNTSNATTPTYRNRTGGALGGAMTGAQAGMMFGAPWLGAIAGGLLGAYA
jgi:hypothetical protein